VTKDVPVITLIFVVLILLQPPQKIVIKIENTNNIAINFFNLSPLDMH
jgi:hypothetical protein